MAASAPGTFSLSFFFLFFRECHSVSMDYKPKFWGTPVSPSLEIQCIWVSARLQMGVWCDCDGFCSHV